MEEDKQTEDAVLNWEKMKDREELYNLIREGRRLLKQALERMATYGELPYDLQKLDKYLNCK